MWGGGGGAEQWQTERKKQKCYHCTEKEHKLCCSHITLKLAQKEKEVSFSK